MRAHGLTTAAGALLLGLPAGVALGRVLWRAFAESLGVLPDPPSPLGSVLLTVAVGLVLAVAATVIPGRLATSTRPAEGLRTE